MSPHLLPILLAGILSYVQPGPPATLAKDQTGTVVRTMSSNGQLVNPPVVAADQCPTVATEKTSWTSVKQIYAPAPSNSKKSSGPRPAAVQACCIGTRCIEVPDPDTANCCGLAGGTVNGAASCTPNPCTTPDWGNLRILLQ